MIVGFSLIRVVSVKGGVSQGGSLLLVNSWCGLAEWNITGCNGARSLGAAVVLMHESGLMSADALTARRVIFVDEKDAYAVVYKMSGPGVLLVECVFRRNDDGAYWHNSTPYVTLFELCFFEDTQIWQALEDTGRGKVVVKECLFAERVPSPWIRLTATGIQRGFAETMIRFSTESMLPTCGGLAGQSAPASRVRNKRVEDWLRSVAPSVKIA